MKISLAPIALLFSLSISAWAEARKPEALTTANALKSMSPGWNLGNSLEAIPTETSWGNPPATLALLKSVRAAGFKSVRIPVAWTSHADANNKIDPKWMARVTDVVKMARKAGLYVMLNVHWDGGWMQPTKAKEAQANQKLRSFWTQIATNFRDFDDHLLFAGTNEVHVDGVYSPPTPENAEVQNGFNQAFVTTVRTTGGGNRTRFLVVQAYNTDIDAAVKSNAVMPNDTVKGRLMMEVHYYAPYDFTLNSKSKIWQWGKTATDPTATQAWANEAYVDGQFEKMKRTFVDKGVPVILGEYCADPKTNFPGAGRFSSLWDEYVTASAFRHGLVPMYWDAGAGGRLFDRKKNSQKDPGAISLITKATQ